MAEADYVATAVLTEHLSNKYQIEVALFNDRLRLSLNHALRNVPAWSELVPSRSERIGSPMVLQD
eukprot:1488505-Amphidinium_carterae.1